MSMNMVTHYGITRDNYRDSENKKIEFEASSDRTRIKYSYMHKSTIGHNDNVYFYHNNNVYPVMEIDGGIHKYNCEFEASPKFGCDFDKLNASFGAKASITTLNLRKYAYQGTYDPITGVSMEQISDYKVSYTTQQIGFMGKFDIPKINITIYGENNILFVPNKNGIYSNDIDSGDRINAYTFGLERSINYANNMGNVIFGTKISNDEILETDDGIWPTNNKIDNTYSIYSKISYEFKTSDSNYINSYTSLIPEIRFEQLATPFKGDVRYGTKINVSLAVKKETEKFNLSVIPYYFRVNDGVDYKGDGFGMALTYDF